MSGRSKEKRMDQQTDAMPAPRPNPATWITDDRRRAYNGSRRPHEIEEDIARTRVRLGTTIEALERELAPGRVIEKSVEVLRSSLEPKPGALRDQVWAYAIPLALAATGLGWLFALRHRRTPVPPVDEARGE
jgi:Protein of unknown function (DUF3618)